MGSGIASVFLAAVCTVLLTDLNPQALAAARDRIAGFPAKAANLAALTLADCDLLLEAAFEDMALKTGLMAQRDRIARPGAVLASNTSSLDLDRIAAATSRPNSMVGLHFYAPA